MNIYQKINTKWFDEIQTGPRIPAHVNHMLFAPSTPITRKKGDPPPLPNIIWITDNKSSFCNNAYIVACKQLSYCFKRMKKKLNLRTNTELLISWISPSPTLHSESPRSICLKQTFGRRGALDLPLSV